MTFILLVSSLRATFSACRGYLFRAGLERAIFQSGCLSLALL